MSEIDVLTKRIAISGQKYPKTCLIFSLSCIVRARTITCDKTETQNIDLYHQQQVNPFANQTQNAFGQMNMGMANMNLSSNPFGAAAPVQPQPTMVSFYSSVLRELLSPEMKVLKIRLSTKSYKKDL